MPCYSTDILADSTFCAHCEELWSAKHDNGFYAVNPATMPKAAQLYKPGKSGVLKKWPEIVAAGATFEEEIQSAKDVFADSVDALAVSFPGVDFHTFCKDILNKAGVLFEDAGRSRNPYRRTAEQQARIGAYVQKMAVLWIRVKAAVKTSAFNAFVKKLRVIAKLVERAARWTVQKEFPEYPVFIGPLVCADIMLAGFTFAEERYHHQVGRVMQNSQEARNLEPVSVGPVIGRLEQWAKSVKKAKRPSPVKRKAAVKAAAKIAASASETPLWDEAASAPSAVAKNLTFTPKAIQSDAKGTERTRGAAASAKVKTEPVSSGKKSMFYAVARGFKTGVFSSWEEANAQVENFSGFRVKKFKSVTMAKQYIAQVQAEPQTVWWVLKHSTRDGAYESEELAEMFKNAGSTLVKRHSLTAAKRFLGKSRLRVYRDEIPPGVDSKTESAHASAAASSAASSQESAAAAPSSQQSVASANAGTTAQFFAIRGGSEDGVYASLKEVLAAVKVGGGMFEVFESEAEAAEFCRPPDATPAAAAAEMFVVWSGKTTGVMSAADCVKATAGVSGAAADGPMSELKANKLWSSKQSEEAQEAGPSQDLKYVEYPSDDEWAAAVAAHQTRVFACWVAEGKGRISFSWDAAAKGVTKNLSVKVLSAEDSLFMNFARAEEYLTTSRADTPIREQIAEARKSIARKPSRKASSTSTAPASRAASKSSSAGQSLGARVGISGVVHTREVTQIRRCFIDAAMAVEVRGSPAEPEEDELERDMPAPGAATYLSEDVSEQVDARGELTLLDFLSYKKSKVKAWPLKDFDEFLSFCRQGQRLCAASTKEVGVANAAMFTELLDIAVRTHSQMLRRGSLGPNELRFKVRMYLHLQYATNYRVLHTGAGAMRAFEAAVDTFGVAKVPRFRVKMAGGTPRRTPQATGDRNATPFKRNVVSSFTGCWLCPAADHMANDPKFHPKSADGKRSPLSADTKQAIFDRIDASSNSAELKHAEKTQVKKYWSQHSL